MFVFFLEIMIFSTLIMLSQMSYRRRHHLNGTTDNPSTRWPQDGISVLDGNCTFDVDVISLTIITFIKAYPSIL